MGHSTAQESFAEPKIVVPQIVAGPYYYRGDNLLLLLNLHLSVKVVIVGDLLNSWRNAFRNIRYAENHSALSSNNETFDLILCHTSSNRSADEFRTNLRQLKNLLTDNGAILIFAENFFSFTNLKKVVNGHMRVLMDGIPCGYVGYKNMLTRIGFPTVHGFVTTTGLATLEELWVADNPEVEIPHYSHPVLKLARKLGCFKYVADGYLFLAAATAIEDSGLVRAIENALVGSRAISACRFKLERVDLRIRGAMVLFITDEISHAQFIVRVVSDKRMAKVIENNHLFLDFLQSLPEMPQEVKRLLPDPRRHLNYADAAIYVETKMDGIPAWKVNKSRLRGAIFQQAVDFIISLNRATRQAGPLLESEISLIFADDLGKIDGCEVIDAHFREELHQLVRRLGELLRQRELYMVAAHGDYGYGNILVDAENGKLRGVIDWDTGKRKDLPGVDLFNLYYQRERIEKHCGLFESFTQVVHDFISISPEEKCAAYVDEFRLDLDIRKLIVYLGFIRDVSRTAQYPDLFASTQKEFQAIYAYLQEIIPL